MREVNLLLGGYESIRAWERDNCRLTFGAALVYLSPLFCMFLMRDAVEPEWKGLTLFMMLLGIALSRGIWRRLLGVTLLICLMVFGHGRTSEGGFVPPTLLLFWIAAGYWVFYKDGQYKLELQRAKEEWE
jgi:hypothetical protein